MSLKIITGNIFTTNCQTIVNAINCVGVMGAGIALECRLRYPDMHERYIELCNENLINIGLLWIYKSPGKWILNFPTKKHWKYPSKKEYLHSGLKNFVSTYKERGVESIAFPLLGADKGGIPQEESLSIIQHYLEPLDMEVEIYRYSSSANDELYETMKKWLLSQDIEYISQLTRIRKCYVANLLDAMQSKEIHQLNQLGKTKGVGIKTLEKIFNFAQNSLNNDALKAKQQILL